jgi:nucleoside-diphosphate-sugar epimerase
MKKLPSIIITGASGFVGRYLIENIKDEFNIFAIARRSRNESNIPFHQNLQWIQCDIANKDTLNEVMNYIKDHGGADFIIHLAAFYDFSYKDNPEYQRTNIEGTKNILEFAKGISVKRFIFASSLAICEFSVDGKPVNEKSGAYANYEYARSKKIGETIVKEYSNFFPCSIVRFAAVYSDWCEYAPLYKFLSNWLSRNIDSRILGGKGESAIPYIHINELITIFRAIFKKNSELTNYEIFLASPEGSTSHKELFEISTRYFFGQPVKPYYLPKTLAYPGLLAKHLLKYFGLTCEEPFERFWMINYIDLKLNADSSYTRKILEWEPIKRFHISRRLLFLLEKMKSHPDEWRLKNESALKRVARRPNLIIYEQLTVNKEKTVNEIINLMFAAERKETFERYTKIDSNDFQCYMSTLYHLLMATVRSGDRSLMIQYIDDIAIRRFAEGFIPSELCATLSLFSEVIISNLLQTKDLAKYKQEIYDYIGLTFQLAQDEVEDLYDKLLQKMPMEKIAESPLMPDCKELQRMIRQLSAFYQISPETGKYYEDMK